MHDYKKLEIWQKSIELTLKVYKSTNEFPKNEAFGLISQMRRASVSISSNIAEGSGRTTKKEFKYFLHISYGSSSELETQLIISTRLNYMDESTSKELLKDLEEIQKMIYTLIKKIAA